MAEAYTELLPGVGFLNHKDVAEGLRPSLVAHQAALLSRCGWQVCAFCAACTSFASVVGNRRS